MDKDKLLAALKAIYQQFLDGYHGGPMTLLRNLIATIEDEPEVLAEEEVPSINSFLYADGHVQLWAETEHITFGPKVINHGAGHHQDVHVTITRRFVAAPEREKEE